MFLPTSIFRPSIFWTPSKNRRLSIRGLSLNLLTRAATSRSRPSFAIKNGISDYLAEIVGDNALTQPEYWEAERVGRDREDKDDYRVKLSVALCFSNRVKLTEYYHNSSFLEYGGSPERAVRQAFTSQIDSYLKTSGKYLKNESKITFADVEDSLVLVSSSFFDPDFL